MKISQEDSCIELWITRRILPDRKEGEAVFQTESNLYKGTENAVGTHRLEEFSWGPVADILKERTLTLRL
jgi:hypothetical protein